MNLRQKLVTALMTAVACFLLLPIAAADQVIPDDLIVQSSLCVGLDCVNGESFGFDTIRLKENNLRIKFQDTSTGSFPSRDWQITANDSASGGANKFSIEDIDGGRVPFTIEAAAPNNSLFVDDGGRVGLGTAVPVLDVHVVSGNTPALRLEQDGSSGFTAHTWDVGGNEANFFVRDVTGGSRLPLRIRPNAPTSSIDIATDGDVGLGTGAPAEALHVVRSGSTKAALRLDGGNAANGFEITRNTVATWSASIGGAGAFLLTDLTGAGGSDDAQQEFNLSTTGTLTISGGLITTGGGGACTAGDPCDGVFKPGFEVESIEDHAAYMWENSHLKAVGPTEENGPINITRTTGGILNELEKAHIYIDRLNERVKEKDAEINQMAQRLARLEALLVGRSSEDTVGGSSQ